MSGMTDEDRAIEMERMVKCIRFAGDVFTKLGESEKKVSSEVNALHFQIEWFDPILAKHEILCANWRKPWLMQAIVLAFETGEMTTCGVWEFAHLAHHGIYEEDLQHG